MKFIKPYGRIKDFFIISLIFTVILPLVTLGSVSLFISTNSLEEQIRADNIERITMITSQIERYIKSSLDELYTLKKLLEEETIYGQDQMDNWLESFTESQDHILSMQVTNQSGIIEGLYPLDENLLGTDVSGFDYFQKSVNSDRGYWSSSFIPEHLGIPISSVSLSWKNGIMTSFLSLMNLKEIVEVTDFNKDKRLLIMSDQKGVFIIHPEEIKVALRENDKNYKYFKNKWDGEAINETISYNGKKYYGFVTFIGNANWKLSIYQPRSSILKPMLSMASLLLTITFFVLFLTIAFGRRLSQGISESLDTLVTTAKYIAKGNYQSNSVKLKFKEFSELSESLVIMSNKILSREEKLKESELRMKTILDSIHVGIIITNPKGNRIVEVNPHALNLLGTTLDKKTGTITNYPIEDQSQIYRTSEKTIVKGNGELINIVKTTIPIILNGRIHNLESFADISEIKIAQKELNKLRNYLSNIINSMPNFLIGIDREGLITFCNKEAISSMGINSDNVIGKHLDEVIPRLSDEMPQVIQAIYSGQTLYINRHAHTVDKVNNYENITVFPLKGEEVQGAVIRIDNITESVRMEERMIQSEKMLSVGGLAAGMAHEINNPLAGLIQTAEVLGKRLSTKKELSKNRIAAEKFGISLESIENYMENRGIPRMLKSINEAGIRIATIVDNMLSFARVSDNTNSTHIVEELIEKTISLAGSDYDLKKKFDFKSIKIIREYENDLPPISCDGAKIQQVLLNILKNGAEAMESDSQKPQFILRTKNDSINQMLIIEIEDNGPGIEKSIQKRVFEPFFTTKDIGVGTGLGLSVSYFIIKENHKGDLRVESFDGKGSNFIIKLPF